MTVQPMGAKPTMLDSLPVTWAKGEGRGLSALPSHTTGAGGTAYRGAAQRRQQGTAIATQPDGGSAWPAQELMAATWLSLHLGFT